MSQLSNETIINLFIQLSYESMSSNWETSGTADSISKKIFDIFDPQMGEDYKLYVTALKGKSPYQLPDEDLLNFTEQFVNRLYTE